MRALDMNGRKGFQYAQKIADGLCGTSMCQLELFVIIHGDTDNMQLAREQLLLDTPEISQEFPRGDLALIIHDCMILRLSDICQTVVRH